MENISNTDKMANSVVIRPAGTEGVKFQPKRDWRDPAQEPGGLA